MSAAPNLEELESLRPFVRGLGYRMTGSVADAEDLVQETFLRVLERPPGPGDLKPWVARVCVNLARDAYRRRRRRPYVGPWLPEPTEDEGVVAFEPAETAARYDLVESASIAFLVALEALSPRQRAVLLLRDVLDWSVEETAAALGSNDGAIKTCHHRARAAMARYDADHARSSIAGARGASAAMLARFAAAMASGDPEELGALFAEGAILVSDGAGEVAATMKPVRGPAKIAKFLLGVARFHDGMIARLAQVNGLPAIVGRSPHASSRAPELHVTALDVGPDGRILGFYSVVAPKKLGAVSFP